MGSALGDTAAVSPTEAQSRGFATVYTGQQNVEAWQRVPSRGDSQEERITEKRHKSSNNGSLAKRKAKSQASRNKHLSGIHPESDSESESEPLRYKTRTFAVLRR